MSNQAKPHAGRALLTRLVDLVVGTHPQLRSRVTYGLHPVLIYLAWCVLDAYSAHVGYMSHGAAQFMMAHNAVGMLAFYPLVRSGWSARFQDSGLILPQILWAASSAILCYALNPPLRPALMQMLCFIHLFGLFTLRPRQLLIIAAATMGMLLLMFAIMSARAAPQFNVGHELFRIAFACLIISLLTWMSIMHSLARGKLSKRKKELAAAMAQVNELITRDSLTGLFNRKHMLELVAQETARQARSGQAFCLVLIDLDFFKRINDGHGHHVGDAVLCSFARAASETLRDTDTIGRWGGEEFLVLMRDTPPTPDALAAIDRLRLCVQAQAPCAQVPALRYSFSAGIAAHADGQAIDATIAQADQALYAAKRAGRSRTMVAYAWPAPPPVHRPRPLGAR